MITISLGDPKHSGMRKEKLTMRPIRPKPLIPTLGTIIAVDLILGSCEQDDGRGGGKRG